MAKTAGARDRSSRRVGTPRARPDGSACQRRVARSGAPLCGGLVATARKPEARLLLATFFALLCLASFLSAQAPAEYTPTPPPAVSLPADAVTLVETSPISQTEFDKASTSYAARVGDSVAVEEKTKTIEVLTTVFIDQAWLRLESVQLGIVVTDEEVLQLYRTILRQTFPTERHYQLFLKGTGQTDQDVLGLVRLDLIRTKLERLWAGTPIVNNDEVAAAFRRHGKRYMKRRHRSVAQTKRLLRRRLLGRKRAANIRLGRASLEARWKPVTMCRPTHAVKTCGIVAP